MFIFAEEKRPRLQQEKPDLSDSELTRLLARMWNELPDKKKVKCLSDISQNFLKCVNSGLIIFCWSYSLNDLGEV